MPFDIYSKDGAEEVFVRTVNSTGPDEAGNVVVSGGGGTVVSVDGVPQETLDIDSTPLTAADVGAIPTGARGTANGVASLDAGGKVPVSELPGGGTGTSGGTMPIAPGMYYTPSNNVSTYFTLAEGSLYTIMFNPTSPVTIDQLGCSTMVAGEAGAIMRIGIYDDAGGYPGTLIAEGTVAADAVGSPYVTVSYATSGAFWLAVVAQNCPATQPQSRVMSGSYMQLSQPGPPTAASGTPFFFVPTGITGALPTIYPPSAPTGSSAPRAWVHAAAS